MVEINVSQFGYSDGDYGISVWLSGLQTYQNGGINYDREVYWFIKNMDTGDERDNAQTPDRISWESGSDYSSTCVFGELAGGTWEISCIVYRMDTGGIVACFTNRDDWWGWDYKTHDGQIAVFDVDEPEPLWTLSDLGYLYKKIDGDRRSVTLTFSKKYYLFRCAVSFKYSGVAEFTTFGSVDTVGILSTSNQWYPESGTVPSYLRLDNDSAGINFRFTYKVEANTKYYVWVKTHLGQELGSTMLWITPPKPRPSNFSWQYPKVQGEEFILTADEWNSLTAKINDFKRYLKGGTGTWGFSAAEEGQPFTAAMYRQAQSHINDLAGGSDIPIVYSGQPVSAYLLNLLVEKLNSIP